MVPDVARMNIIVRNIVINAKFLKQSLPYRYHKLRRAFSKVYDRHRGLMENI